MSRIEADENLRAEGIGEQKIVFVGVILGRFCLLRVWLWTGSGGRGVCRRRGMGRLLGGLLSGWLGFVINYKVMELKHTKKAVQL